MTKEVFDLDAVAAASTGAPFVFRFGGEDYTLPPRVDVRVSALLGAGRLYEALRTMLGAEQWQRMQDSSATMTDEGFTGLMAAYGQHGRAQGVSVDVPQIVPQVRAPKRVVA